MSATLFTLLLRLCSPETDTSPDTGALLVWSKSLCLYRETKVQILIQQCSYWVSFIGERSSACLTFQIRPQVLSQVLPEKILESSCISEQTSLGSGAWLCIWDFVSVLLPGNFSCVNHWLSLSTEWDTHYEAIQPHYQHLCIWIYSIISMGAELSFICVFLTMGTRGILAVKKGDLWVTSQEVPGSNPTATTSSLHSFSNQASEFINTLHHSGG